MIVRLAIGIPAAFAVVTFAAWALGHAIWPDTTPKRPAPGEPRETPTAPLRASGTAQARPSPGAAPAAHPVPGSNLRLVRLTTEDIRKRTGCTCYRLTGAHGEFLAGHICQPHADQYMARWEAELRHEP